MKQFLRSLIFPGLDLHTRNRAHLCRFWKAGKRDVLDAGSGNGYFSWLAYQSGANVTAFNFDAGQVQKAQQFFIGFRKGNPERLRFEQMNLYHLERETRTFDEIICYETLEHIRDDRKIVAQFHRILRPGGILHLCCPNKLHPRHQAEILDLEEKGGHVRHGYTDQDYRELLLPAGFTIDRIAGVGCQRVYQADLILRTLRSRIGDWAALPIFPFFAAVVRSSPLDPEVPFSIYVKASKPGAAV